MKTNAPKRILRNWLKGLLGERFLSIVITEQRILLRHLRYRLNPTQRKRLSDLREKTGLCLHIGSGGNLFDGWVNIDISEAADIVCDIRRGIPFPDNSVKYIFTEHTVEHLDYKREVPAFFRECARVLQGVGTMRIIVPDIKLFIDAYNRDDLEWFNFIEDTNFITPGEGLAFTFLRDGEHHMGWDYPTLATRLKEAGFSEVIKTEYRKSPVEDLNLEQDNPVRAAHSLCVNVTK